MDTPHTDVPIPPQHHTENASGRVKRFVTKSKDIASIFGVVLRFAFYVFIFISFAGVFGLLGLGSDTLVSHSVLYGDGPEKIAVIPLNGVITETAQSSSLVSLDQQSLTPNNVYALLKGIEKDSLVAAVVLRINSPGGSVTASEEIYQLITRFKEKTNIPVYVSMSEVAASGGYYISLAADKIIADPTTLTGSIGVISSNYNLNGLAEQYGVESVTVTSGENKAFLDPLNEVDPKQIAIIKSIVDEIYEQFLDRITTNREIADSTLSELADGRPLSGKQAKEAGFVDEIAGYYDSLEMVQNELQLPDAQVIEYSNGSFLSGLLGAVSQSFGTSAIDEVFPWYTLQGKMLYLYLP